MRFAGQFHFPDSSGARDSRQVPAAPDWLRAGLTAAPSAPASHDAAPESLPDREPLQQAEGSEGSGGQQSVDSPAGLQEYAGLPPVYEAEGPASGDWQPTGQTGYASYGGHAASSDRESLAPNADADAPVQPSGPSQVVPRGRLVIGQAANLMQDDFDDRPSFLRNKVPVSEETALPPPPPPVDVGEPGVDPGGLPPEGAYDGDLRTSGLNEALRRSQEVAQNPLIHQPQPLSEPGYQQFTVGGLDRRDPPTDPAPPASVDAFLADSSVNSDLRVPTINDLQRTGGMAAAAMVGSDPPLTVAPASPYLAQTFGEPVRRAVDADGKPLYVPEIPAEEEDTTAYGRHVAGVAWLIFAAFMGAGFVIAGKMSLGGAFLTPMVLAGLFMLTAVRWSGVVGLLLSFVYGLTLGSVGSIILREGSLADTVLGIEQSLPDPYGFVLIGLGISFIVANVLMLVASPGMTRALTGAFLLVLPQVGAILLLATSEIRPKLVNPLDGPNPEALGTPQLGITFSKPQDWYTYPWTQMKTFSPMAMDLTTEPLFWFVNEKQDIMVAFYYDEARRSLAQLFGGPERLTPLEREVTREMASQSETPSSFSFGGKVFVEELYEGTVSSGQRLSLIVDKTQVGDKTLLVVLTRDARHNSSRTEGETALNLFYKTLKFHDAPPEAPEGEGAVKAPAP